MIPKSVKVTGDGAVHTFASALGVTKSKWVQASLATTNVSPVFVGGAEVSTTPGVTGFPLTSAYIPGQFFPAISEISNFYQLDLSYYWAAAGDTFYLLAGLD